MNTKLFFITLTTCLLLAGNAQAEPGKLRDWLHKKTAPQTEQAAPTPAPVAAAPLTVEQQECNRLVADIRARNLRPDQVDQAKNNRCAEILREAKTPVASTDAKDLPAVEVKADRPRSQTNLKTVMEQGGKGCGIGAAIVGMFGGPAEAGCALGGVIAGARSYQQQLKQVREVETVAKQAGVQTTVATTQEADAKGKTQEKLKSMSLTWKPGDLQPITPAWRGLLDKLGAMAKGSKQPLTLTFTGTNPACRVPLDDLRSQDALAQHTVVDRCGQGANEIVITQAAQE